MIQKLFLIISFLTVSIAPLSYVEAASKTNETSSLDVKNQTVYVTRTGAKYHRIGCGYLKSVIPIKLKDARLQGYEPCKVCQPQRF